jgi:hypothetical protein
MMSRKAEVRTGKGIESYKEVVMKVPVAALIALALQAAVYSQATPKLSLKLDREPNKDGRAVRVWVRVTNISQQNLEVPVSADADSEYTFAVAGPDGGPPPPTRDAEKQRRTPRGSGSRVVVSLAPGQSVAFGNSLLSDFVDFSKPGTYRITATRHFAPPIDETDTSDVLEIKVP